MSLQTAPAQYATLYEETEDYSAKNSIAVSTLSYKMTQNILIIMVYYNAMYLLLCI